MLPIRETIAAIFAYRSSIEAANSAGVLLRKSTRQVIEEASGPKFPSTDLVIWAGLPAALVLIYVMLAGRGLSVGGWLGKRS